MCIKNKHILFMFLFVSARYYHVKGIYKFYMKETSPDFISLKIIAVFILLFI